MEHWVPHLKRVHTPNAGHWVQLEQPKLFTDALVQWLHSTFPRPCMPSLPSAEDWQRRAWQSLGVSATQLAALRAENKAIFEHKNWVSARHLLSAIGSANGAGLLTRYELMRKCYAAYGQAYAHSQVLSWSAFATLTGLHLILPPLELLLPILVLPDGAVHSDSPSERDELAQFALALLLGNFCIFDDLYWLHYVLPIGAGAREVLRLAALSAPSAGGALQAFAHLVSASDAVGIDRSNRALFEREQTVVLTPCFMRFESVVSKFLRRPSLNIPIVCRAAQELTPDPSTSAASSTKSAVKVDAGLLHRWPYSPPVTYATAEPRWSWLRNIAWPAFSRAHAHHNPQLKADVQNAVQEFLQRKSLGSTPPIRSKL